MLSRELKVFYTSWIPWCQKCANVALTRNAVWNSECSERGLNTYFKVARMVGDRAKRKTGPESRGALVAIGVAECCGWEL